MVVVKVGNELPAPLAPSPIATLLFVQVNVVVPAGVFVEVKFNVPVVTVVPLQKIWLAGTVTFGTGFTVTVARVVLPLQVP